MLKLETQARIYFNKGAVIKLRLCIEIIQHDFIKITCGINGFKFAAIVLVKNSKVFKEPSPLLSFLGVE